jgi:hypothetical protein
VEAISFLASNGPPNVVVVGHSVDSIYTAIAKLEPIFDLSDTDCTLFLATTTNYADMLPRDEELSSSREGIWWLTFRPASLLATPILSPTLAAFQTIIELLDQNQYRQRQRQLHSHRHVQIPPLQFGGWQWSRLRSIFNTPPQYSIEHPAYPPKTPVAPSKDIRTGERRRSESIRAVSVVQAPLLYRSMVF